MEVGRVKEKPENRKTITIKINGKDRPFQEKEVPEDSEHTSINNRNHSRMEESFYKEESAAGSEGMADDAFDWILPLEEEESKDIKEFQVNAPGKPNKTKNPFSFRKNTPNKTKNLPKGMIASIFFAVFFAILLGTGFGFVLLNMINTNEQATSSSNAATATTSGETEDSSTVASNSEKATLQEIQTFVVQNIILSSEDAVKQRQSQLSDAGYISQSIDVDNKKVVYLGVADTLVHAKSIKEKMEKDKIDAFAKEMSFGGGEISGISSTEKTFVENAPAIFQNLTIAVSTAEYDSSITEEVKTELEQQMTVLEELKIEEFQNEKIKSMATALNEALTLAINWKEDSSKDISAIQSELLAFLSAYHTI